MSPLKINPENFLNDDVREEPPEIGGGGTNRDLPPKGYGGGGDYGDSGELVGRHRHRLRRGLFGMGLSMLSVSMLFIALTVAFLVRDHASVLDQAGVAHTAWMRVDLPPI